MLITFQVCLTDTCRMAMYYLKADSDKYYL